MEIIERVSILETDVAVIQSNYVRRDEFAVLREEVGIGFANVDTKFAKTDGKIEQLRVEVNGKFDQLREAFDAKLGHAIVTMLKWTFGVQISIVAAAIAAIKYL